MQKNVDKSICFKNDTRFFPSRIYDFLVVNRAPLFLFAIVFVFILVFQILICAYEGTLFNTEKVSKPLIDHITVLVGGGLLIPTLFYQAAKFYRVVEHTLNELVKKSILSLDNRIGQFTKRSKTRTILVNFFVLVFVCFVDFIQFSGANADINYIHVIGGKLTICGWYYTVIFIPLAYCLIILIYDLFAFSCYIRRLCMSGLIHPKLFYPDEKCGLSDLISLGLRFVFIVSLLGVYFFVLIYNWKDSNTIKSLLFNFEEMLIMISFFIITPLLLLIYYMPIRRVLINFKENIAEKTFSSFGLYDLENVDSIKYTAKITELYHNGFFNIYEKLLKLDSRIFEFRLFLKMYSLLIVPFLFPIVVVLITDIVKNRVLQ